MKQIKLLLIFLVIFVSSCASTQAGGDQLPVPSKWKLASFVKSGTETAVLQGSTITLGFERDGQAGGTGGCNSYGATYEIKDHSISFKDLISTLIACVDEQVNRQEQQYYQALQASIEYEISGDNLIILYDDGQSQLNFIKQ